MQSLNKIQLACAGAGKTYNIAKNILSLTNHKKILVITYTNRGIEAIKAEIEKQNFGLIPSYVEIKSWYSFLLSELIKPFQVLQFNKINNIRGLDFNNMYGVDFTSISDPNYYITKNNDMKARYIAKLATKMIAIFPIIIERIENYCSHIYFDEIQDFAGEDIDILEAFFNSKISVYCVGDNKQATFSTHTSRSKIKKGKQIFKYLYTNKNRLNISIAISNESRRMIPELASFANLIYPLNPIIGIQNSSVKNMGVYLIMKDDILTYKNFFNPVLLKYDIKIDTLGLPAINYGESKGMTFERTIIYPNKVFTDTLKHIDTNRLKAPEKYYIAVTRAKFSIAIVVNKLFENSAFRKIKLNVGDTIISACKYNFIDND